MKENFLVEIGTEELPPKALKTLATSFADNVEAELNQAGLTFDKIEWFAAPRRLAVKVLNLATQQPSKEIEKRGSAGAVHSGDEHSDILVVGQVGSVGHGKDTGELDTQIVPVADLVADLDFDGVAGAGTAAAQHGSSAQSCCGGTGTLEEGAAGNFIGHGCVPP